MVTPRRKSRLMLRIGRSEKELKPDIHGMQRIAVVWRAFRRGLTRSSSINAKWVDSAPGCKEKVKNSPNCRCSSEFVVTAAIMNIASRNYEADRRDALPERISSIHRRELAKSRIHAFRHGLLDRHDVMHVFEGLG